MFFKIIQLIPDAKNKIYIFTTQYIIGLYKSDKSNTYFDDKLSEKDKNEELIWNDNYIHTDDSIETIKKKIVQVMNKTVAFEEIYLFSIKPLNTNINQIYQELTQDDTISITQTRFFNFLSNISPFNNQSIERKDTYKYEDLLEINLDQSLFLNIPIGQSINIEKKYPFVVNPFEVKTIDLILEQYSQDLISTQNKKLLLDYGNINTIYMCNASDVLNETIKTELNQESMIKMYYPFLYKLNILSFDQLTERKQELLDKSKKLITKQFIKNNENVDLFYNIYNEKTKELDYVSRGIKELKCIIHPLSPIKLPIDVIFKLISSSFSLPFIKYNPSKKNEKIFRLFANKQTSQGKKIPYLSKTKLTKLNDTISKEKSVGMYLTYTNDDNINSILVFEFFINGNISIKINNTTLLYLKEIETIVRNTLNPLLKTINNFIEQGGYAFLKFESFNDNTEILNIHYNTSIAITKEFKIDKYIGCISSIFTILENNLTKGIILDYKRVDYYNKMDSIDKFITQWSLNNKNLNEIVPLIVDNFDLKEEEAKLKVSAWISSIQVEQNLFSNKKLKIKTNPGFPVKIEHDPFNNNITISIENINNILYLPHIQVYFDTLIRLTQDIKSTKVPKTIINKLCKPTKREIEIEAVEDVVSRPETPFEEREELSIEGNVITFNEDDEDDDLLDMLYGDNENDDDDENDDDNIEFGEEITIESDEKKKTQKFSKKNEDDDDDDILKELKYLDEDENEEEEEKEEEKEKEKKEKNEEKNEEKNNDESEELIKDIDGMSLNNPNYFFERMYKRDPKLFLKAKDGRFNAYSRICPHTLRRQPVILTDKEKEKIDKNHPNSYSKAIKYGSSSNKQFWYICPRYWCLKDNTSLTEEEVKAGVCGGQIIPMDAKTVPKGKYIYEFNVGEKNNEHLDKDGNYITHYPGFLKKDSHPDNSCIPCCFKYWDADSQVQRRQQCLQNKEVITKSQKVVEDYIKNPNKFPLKQNALGYLPMNAQKLLNNNNELCQVSKKDKSLKEFYPCLIRKGVENNNNQSFLGAIADIYSEFTRYNSSVSISQLKQIILGKLNLDIFITLQNGNLVTLFEKELPMLDINQFSTTDIYKKLNMDNIIRSSSRTTEEQRTMDYFIKIASSFMNYINFIRDDTIDIDYAYLWDFVTKYLFDIPVNMIILDSIENDITDNIEIICPSNHYAGQFFNAKDKTIILIKREKFYEPIYQYENDGRSINIKTKLFDLQSETMSSELKKVITNIKNNMVKCKPYNSLPNVYKFKMNFPLVYMIEKLSQNKDFSIINQVLNYNNKVVGLIITLNSSKPFYIPFEPSSIINSLPLITIDAVQWNNYTTTLSTLTDTYNLLDIPCQPRIKVLEDNLIVGILTETNQFIPINPPSENIYDDTLRTYEGLNYVTSDNKTLLSNEKDTKRIETIKKIRLEHRFYNAFRNTVRRLLNTFEYKNIRNSIEDIIKDANLYLTKLNKIYDILKELTQSFIIFKDYDLDEVIKLENISTCIYNSTCSERPYCQMTENDVCAIVLPKLNLISKANNENIYFGRVADELIRFNKIRNYILFTDNYLNFEKIDYNLHANEIILLNSILFKGDYFEDIEDVTINNPYVTHNTYDTAFPNKSIRIDNTINLKERTISTIPEKCNKEIKLVGKTEKWFPLLPKNTKIVNFDINHECSFQIIIDIINDYTQKIYTSKGIKTILLNLYIPLLKKFGNSVLDTLQSQGKVTFINDVRNNILTFDNYIMSEHYYITNFDIVLLAKHFKLPIIIISSTKLKENKKDSMSLNSNEFYYIIKQFGITKNEMQRYALLLTENETLKFNITQLSIPFFDKIKENALDMSTSIFIIKVNKVRSATTLST